MDIREYKKGDEKQIIVLFNEIFNASKEEIYWKWQFMDNPSGEPVIVVAEDNSRLIGQCTLLPTKIVIKGEEVAAGQSIDTMIAKDYRGKGIYEELAKKSYAIASEKEIKIRIGFPTGQAFRGLLGDIGATIVTDIPLFINPYTLDNFLLSVVKIKVLAKILAIPSILITKLIYKEQKIKIKEPYTFKEVKKFDEEFDIFWDKIKTNTLIMTKRDSKFLNWRITEHPKIDYKTFAAYLNDILVGYIVIKIENRKLTKKNGLRLGSIIDIVGIDEDVIASLYLKSKEYFKSQKTDFVVCWVSESMKYRELFIRLGFFKTTSTVPFVVKDLSVEKELEAYALEEKNWYIMPIESDIY